MKDINPGTDRAFFKSTSIEKAIQSFRLGRILVMVDDEDRENEGDLITASELITPEKINFMAKHGRGLICVAMSRDRLSSLNLNPMVEKNTSKMGTSFTISVDAVQRTTTGISAFDRAETVKTLVDPLTRPEDLARPGHVFPLRAAQGGVLSRAGHTEAVVDLARLAGLTPAGVLCEIMSDDGRMARLPELIRLAKKFDLDVLTIRDLIAYRRIHDKLVRCVVQTKFPTRYGDFTLRLYESVVDEHHHVALVKGPLAPEEPILVRVHSECLTGDVFGSLRCDCGEQLHKSLEAIEKEGRGVFLYMRQEGRGIGLSNKIRAYELQDKGKDTVEANETLGFAPDLRDYGIGAQILVDLGVRKLRLLTNNPKKLVGLQGYGLEIVERVPLEVVPNPINLRYLETKRDKLGHLISNRKKDDFTLPKSTDDHPKKEGS